MVASGALNGFSNILIITLIQVTTPGRLLGRVFSVLTTIAGALSPIAMGLSGVVADALNQNIPVIYIGSGLTTTVLAVVMLSGRETRAFLATDG